MRELLEGAGAPLSEDEQRWCLLDRPGALDRAKGAA